MARVCRNMIDAPKMQLLFLAPQASHLEISQLTSGKCLTLDPHSPGLTDPRHTDPGLHHEVCQDA